MEGAIRRDFGKDAAQRRQNILRFDATHRREENRRRRTQKARGRGDEKRLLFLSRKVHHSLGDLPAPVGDIYSEQRTFKHTTLLYNVSFNNLSENKKSYNFALHF